MDFQSPDRQPDKGHLSRFKLKNRQMHSAIPDLLLTFWPLCTNVCLSDSNARMNRSFFEHCGHCFTNRQNADSNDCQAKS